MSMINKIKGKMAEYKDNIKGYVKSTSKSIFFLFNNM